MAIFGSFGHCLPNILHTWPHDSFQVIQLSMTFGIFQGHWTVYIKFLKIGVWYGKSYYRQLIGNHTLDFDWCHFWWPWSTFEGHFSLDCYFHVHFSYPWHAFASHGLPAIAELLVFMAAAIYKCKRFCCFIRALAYCVLRFLGFLDVCCDHWYPLRPSGATIKSKWHSDRKQLLGKLIENSSELESYL